jgi:hypothetical protein
VNFAFDGAAAAKRTANGARVAVFVVGSVTTAPGLIGVTLRVAAEAEWPERSTAVI